MGHRILHLIDTTGPGGAETVFVELATGLDPERWPGLAVVTGPGWVCDQVEARGIQPVVVPSLQRSFDVRFLGRLVRVIRRHRIDLVQTHLLGSAVYGVIAARWAGARVVCTFHGHWDLQGAGRLRAFKRWLVDRGADRLVFVSESLRTAFREAGFVRGGRTGSAVIHNGVVMPEGRGEREGVRRDLGIADGQFLVGAIGNVRPAKRYDIFIDAAAQVCARCPGVRFVIAGDTANPEFPPLVRRRAALKLEQQLTFLGFRDDVWGLVGALDLLVNTSDTEGFSLTTVQALAAGTPVLATRSGGPEEIVDDGRTGLLVPRGEVERVASGILRLLDDPALRASLAGAGQAEAARRFPLRRMLLEYENMYRQVLGRGSQTG
jgi:glycosyltransferase involved in cell wall biosynthesis